MPNFGVAHRFYHSTQTIDSTHFRFVYKQSKCEVQHKRNEKYHIALLWEDPDPDFWSVAFLWSKSFFRSVICRIHSGQGFIGSLIWVICKRIIRSMIRRVPLGEGSETNHYAQRFWPWITYVLHIWYSLPRSVDSICVVVSGLLKFKPISAYYWVKVIRKSAVPVKYKYLNGLC